MKANWKAPVEIWMVLVLLLLMAELLESCHVRKRANLPSTVYYTCPMHSKEHEDKPGRCPICGMKLVRVSVSGGAPGGPDTAFSDLLGPVTGTVVGSFKVTSPVKASLTDTIKADGYIGFDQRKTSSVASRVAGRIDQLYVKYANQPVRKGQPLMKIYSPQLLSAQKNLLQSIQDGESALAASLKTQLLNLGMSDEAIEKVIRSGHAETEVTLYSPETGISRPIPEQDQKYMPEEKMMQRMRNDPGQSSEPMVNASWTARENLPEVLTIRKGMYVGVGQTVFNIQRTHPTWAILRVFTPDLWHLHLGEAVKIYAEADPANGAQGKVDFISPDRPVDDKTSGIRVYLNRMPPSWKIGTLVHGYIYGQENGNGWYLPLSAVHFLGTRAVVWVQDKAHPDVFRVRDVQAAMPVNDSIQILSGIGPDDKVVEDAGYMVDSDSFTD